MADAVALVDDLFFQAKMTETARHTGVDLKTVADCDALLREAAANPGATLLLDLNARGSKPLEALARLRELSHAGSDASASAQPDPHAPGNSAPRRVIAFLSHVQTELADQARAAGCDEVMPRSKFTAELPRILREARTVNAQ
jgi:CheY-like chemotaxis protein